MFVWVDEKTISLVILKSRVESQVISFLKVWWKKTFRKIYQYFVYAQKNITEITKSIFS